MAVKNKKFNEINLILSCCRVQIDDSNRNKIKNILSQQFIDWNFVVSQSVHHHIAPLVYRNLIKIENIPVSNAVLSELKTYYIFTLTNNLYFWSECQQLLRNFSDTGIKAVPLKGIFFAHLIYHDLGLRPMSDVDILIQEKDFYKAEKILYQSDFKKCQVDYPDGFRKKYLYHLTYLKQLTNRIIFPLELHWNFIRPQNGKTYFADIWSRVSSGSIDGEKVLLLSKEDNLLRTALQIKSHISHRLMSICDITELLKFYENNFDWYYVAKTAIHNEMEIVLYSGLSAAKNLLNAPMPDNFLNEFKIGLFKKDLINKYICNKEKLFKGRKNIFYRTKNIFLHLLLSERKISFFIYILFMPIEEFARFCSLPIPSIKTNLLYFVRVFYIPFTFR